jgi:tol-pal system protein YbgF
MPKKPMHNFLKCAIFTAWLFANATSYAGLFDDDEARKAILDLRTKVELQNKEIAARQAELAARTELLEQTTKGILQLQNQIQLLREEIAKLRGSLEVQSNDISGLQKQTRDLSKEQKDLSKEQKDLAAATETKLKKLDPIVAQVDGRQITVEANEQRRYEAAIAQVRAGDFKSALASLSQFQIAYPESGYGPSVNYWIGNSHYANKDYKNAIATLQSLVASHPDYSRNVDAIFTTGLAQIESGDRRAGRRTLEVLIERFPEAPVALSAKERLATLRP